MNSWDNDPDELLRRRWQRVFADFEVKPPPSVSRRIFTHLTTEGGQKPGRWLVAALFVLLSVGVLYQARLDEQAQLDRGKAATVKSRTTSQPLSTSRIHRPATLVQGGASVSSVTTPDLPPNAGVAHQQSSSRPPTRLEPTSYQTEASPKSHAIPNPLILSRAKWSSRIRAMRQTHHGITKPARSKLSRSSAIHFPSLLPNLPETVGYEPTSAPAIQLPNATRNLPSTSQSLVSQPSVHALPLAWTQLRPRGMVRFPGQLRGLPTHLPTPNVDRQRPVLVKVARQRWRWFIDAVPLSSFQWMSASPASTAYLSHVNVPPAFSPVTWGYQLNGGVRFRHWQAYLSAGQLRRWAYYTINENRFWIEPSATDPHQLMQEVHTVTENGLLAMVGVGLSQQRLLAQGRYAVELGGQVSYLPTNDRALFGLRGSASRRVLLNQHMELQVGLTAEYGLNRLFSEQKQLIIHPFAVGLGIRLQPRFQP